MDYFTEIYLLLDGTQGTDLYSDAYDAAESTPCALR